MVDRRSKSQVMVLGGSASRTKTEPEDKNEENRKKVADFLKWANGSGGSAPTGTASETASRQAEENNTREEQRRKVTDFLKWANGKTAGADAPERQTEYSSRNYAAERAAKYGASREDYDSRNRARNTVRRVTATPEAQEYDRLKSEQSALARRAESHVLTDEEANRARELAERINAYETSRDYERRQAAEKLLEDAKAKQATGKRASEYAALMREPDFAELSQYRSTQHGMPKYTSVPSTSSNFGMPEYTARGGGGYYEDTGFDDLTYDYINGSELARTVAKADENTLSLTEAGIGSDRLQRMTPDEIAIYNYLYSKQGKEAADEFIEFIASDPNYSEGSLNARQRQHEEELFAEEARENPFGASLYTVLNSPRRGVAYVGQIGDLMEDGEIDQNAGYNRYSYADTAIRNEVSKKIEESGKWGSVGSFLYNTGMSMGDFLLQGALFGGVSENLALGIMGTGAAADATIAAKDRGLDDTNAFALGTIAGFAEIVTEKFSLDRLLKEAKPGKSALLRWLAEAGVEGSEEGASDLINWVADLVVAGDEGEWRTAVRNYESQGMSESEAFGHALADKAAEIGLDIAGGALSGGLVGIPGAVTQAKVNRRAGAAGRAAQVQQEESTAIDTDEAGHTPEERRVIEEYQGAVDPGLVDFYNNAAQSDGNVSGSYQLKDVSDRAAAEVKRILGRDVSGFRTVFEARQARHISNDHGANGRSDRTMADANDVGRIQYVLDNFDTAEAGGRSGAYVERSANGRNRQAPTVNFSKKVDGTYFVIEAAPDTQARTMYVVSAYMLGEGKTAPGRTNKMTGEASQSLDAETPRRTSEIESENTSPVNVSVPQPARDVNTEQARPAAVQAYDTARMVRAGAALGESGEKALNASYDPAIPADRYYRGFSEYYEAGVQGRSESDVKQDAFTSALNSAQRYAAYSAGRNDAAASLAREERAKNFAKTAGEDSGLVFDDYVSRELDEKTANRINAVAKRLGTRVRFTEPGSIRGGTANAAISGAEVLIEKNNPNPVMFLLGHEWTHRMQELAPQEYRRFRQAAANVEDVRLNAERTAELYRRQGVELTYEEALDEAAADYAGQMLDEDGAVLDRFIAEHRDDRTLLQRVRDAIRSLVNRLTGRERRGAESAVRKLDEALRAAERQAARLSENSGNARESGTRRYSLGEYDKHQIDNWRNSKRIVVYENEMQLRRFISDALTGNNLQQKMYFGTVTKALAERIKSKTGIDVEGYNCSISASEIRKIFKDHGDSARENLRGQRAINEDDIVLIPTVIQEADDIILQPELYNGRPVINFVKTLNGRITVTAYTSSRRLDLTVQTMFAGNKKRNLATPTGEQAPINTPEANSGTVPNISISEDSEDVNGKFSLKGTETNRETAELERENARLRERIERLRQNTRITTRENATAKRSDIDRLAGEILKEYGIGLHKTDVMPELQKLGDAVLRAGSDTAWEDIHTPALELARRMVENADVLNDEDYRRYSELRRELRETKINVPRELWGDFESDGGYNAFRQKNMGRLNLSSTGGISADTIYDELAEMYPELFDADLSNETDRLHRMADVLDGLRPVYENPYSGDMDRAAEYIAQDIIDRLLGEDVRQNVTYADRQTRKKTAQRQKYLAALERVRTQRDAKLRALERRYRARTEKARERQSAAKLRAQITRHASDLSRKLLSPSDKRHVPEALRGPVAALLDAINRESPYTYDENGVRHRNAEGTPTARTEAFAKLREQYAKIIKDGGDMVIDPALLGDAASGFDGLFDEVTAMRDVRLADMSTAQLEKVWQTLRAVEHSISSAGKILSQAKFERTAEWAEAFRRDTDSRRQKRSLMKLHPMLGLETPFTFFHHYGAAGEAVYRMLRDAQDRQQVMTSELAEKTRKIADAKTVRELNRETHDFVTERGDKLTLTAAQMMELYELSKRGQAEEHLSKGGIVQPEIRSKRIRRGTESILLTAGDLAAIADTLTDSQKKTADELQQLTVGILADYGNEASMAAYGYRKFTGTDYWPIKTAREGVHSSVETGGGNTRSIKNIGMAKAVVPHASNALDIAGIFDTFANHAADMIDYAAWLCPMEDANRLYNYQYVDAEGNRTGTLKGLLDRAGGDHAQEYWSRLMEDIQNGISAPQDDAFATIMAKGVGNFKGAAVGGNLRVVIQQPTAFFRAAAVLGPQDLTRGLAKGVTKGSGWRKALKYSPTAMRKDSGGFDISSPAKMGETLFDSGDMLHRVSDKMSFLAAKADALTWGKLWNACEWKTAREHSELRKGSNAFYEEVNRAFTEVIDKTQVMDGVLQRSNVMRSSNALVQQATAFMGEPIMSLNLTMRAWEDFRYEQNPKKRGRALKRLGQAGTALLVTHVINALAQSLIDAMRADDPDKKYWERFREAFTGIGDEESPWEKAWAFMMNGNFGSDINPIGQIPYAKDILSLVQGYDVSRTDMDTISDLVRAATTARDSLGGNGRRTTAYAIKELLSAGAKMFGIPVGNILRDVLGAVRTAAIETECIPLQYELEKGAYNIESGNNKGRFYDILFRALEQGDTASYEHISADMTASGVATEEDIEKAMRTRRKKSETFTEAQSVTESGLVSALEQSQGYRALAPEWQEKAQEAAADYATATTMLEQDPDYTLPSTYAWVEKADEGASVGIDPTEYILFRTALQMANEDGSLKQDEVIDALDSMTWLSRAEKSYLFGTKYKSDKNNPWK